MLSLPNSLGQRPGFQVQCFRTYGFLKLKESEYVWIYIYCCISNDKSNNPSPTLSHLRGFKAVFLTIYMNTQGEHINVHMWYHVWKHTCIRSCVSTLIENTKIAIVWSSPPCECSCKYHEFIAFCMSFFSSMHMGEIHSPSLSSLSLPVSLSCLVCGL